MLEPAAFGAAVSFGPHTENFRDISQLLLDAGAARVVPGNELCCFVADCLEAPTEARAMGQRASRFVQQHRGATRRTVELLSATLQDAVSRAPLAGPHRLAVRSAAEQAP